MALAAPPITARRSPALRRRPLPALLFTGAGLALVPWMAVLAKTLPQTTEVAHWATAWIGLDAMLAAGLVGTGVLLRRRDPRVAQVAAATAALLVVDAWFDVTLSTGRADRATALALAVAVELPLAVVCAVAATRRTP